MCEKIKNLLKRVVPLPIRTFLLIMDEVTVRILSKIDQSLSSVRNLHRETRSYCAQSVEQHQKQVSETFGHLLAQTQQINSNLEQLRIQQKKQQELLDSIIKQQQIMQEIAAHQEQNQKELLENAITTQKDLWSYILNSVAPKACSWDAVAEKIPELGEAFPFFKCFYDQHDLLTQSGVSSDVRREYVNNTLAACLGHLHTEQDPERKQFLYDALKNQVIDDLELSGYEESFYYDQNCYRELCEIVNRAYDGNYFPVLSKAFYDKALEKWFHQKTGQTLNLENPVTYNDKINWIKLYEHDPRKSQYADKYAVRKYVADTIGSQYLIPLLGVWDHPEEIDFDSLPNQFALKANHGAAWNIIVPDKSTLNIPETVERMKGWLGKKFSHHACLELHYDAIPPRILAEEYQENGGGELNDYKVWCFDGKVHFIQYLKERHHGLKMAFYDREWNKLPFTTGKEQIKDDLEKPDNLDELITLAEKLSAGFNHVRVDFYRLNSGEWKFGEMTFTPTGGKCCWNPPEYDKIIGELFVLDNTNKTTDSKTS